jgi:hypothetical protein
MRDEDSNPQRSTLGLVIISAFFVSFICGVLILEHLS